MLCFFPQHQFDRLAAAVLVFSQFLLLEKLERNFSPQQQKTLEAERQKFRWKRSWKKSVMCTMNEWENDEEKIHKRAKVPLLLVLLAPFHLAVSSTLTLAQLFRSQRA